MSFRLENGRGAAHFVVFSDVVLVPWLFAPESAAAMPHAGDTTKTVKGALCLLSLMIAAAAPTGGFGSQIFVFLHDFYQFLIDHDDFFRKSAVGSRECLDCGSIVCGGGRKVGNGVHGLLLDLLVEVLHGGVVGRMVSKHISLSRIRLLVRR